LSPSVRPTGAQEPRGALLPGASLYAGYTDDLTRDLIQDQGLIRNSRTVFLKTPYLVRTSWKGQ